MFTHIAQKTRIFSSLMLGKSFGSDIQTYFKLATKCIYSFRNVVLNDSRLLKSQFSFKHI